MDSVASLQNEAGRQIHKGLTGKPRFHIHPCKYYEDYAYFKQQISLSNVRRTNKLDKIIHSDIATPDELTSCPCFRKIWRRWENGENYFDIEIMVNLLAQNTIHHLLTNIRHYFSGQKQAQHHQLALFQKNLKVTYMERPRKEFVHINYSDIS